MLNFSDELISKAKEAKSVEELLILAKENNVELTEEEAQIYYTELNQKSGELPDEELDNVAGGGCNDNFHNPITTIMPQASATIPNRWICPFCGTDSVVEEVYFSEASPPVHFNCSICKKTVHRSWGNREEY
jgi:hypothetical protein